MIATPQPPNMTIAEYLEWEPLQEFRYEYVHGNVIAISGGTIPHNDIALNLYRTLYPQVRSKGCRINVADVKVEVSSNNYYPDEVYFCPSCSINSGDPECHESTWLTALCWR
jgi:Uma2 family endonuclease